MTWLGIRSTTSQSKGYQLSHFRCYMKFQFWPCTWSMDIFKFCKLIQGYKPIYQSFITKSTQGYKQFNKVFFMIKSTQECKKYPKLYDQSLQKRWTGLKWLSIQFQHLTFNLDLDLGQPWLDVNSAHKLKNTNNLPIYYDNPSWPLEDIVDTKYCPQMFHFAFPPWPLFVCLCWGFMAQSNQWGHVFIL